MPEASYKLQPLTIFLIKTGLRRYEDAFKKPRELQRRALKQRVSVRGALFVASQRQAAPTWLQFVETGLARSLDELYNASTRNVPILDRRLSRGMPVL